MLAKGSCTRVEWDHLPLLKNMNFSMRNKFFLLKKGSGMTFLLVVNSEDIPLKPKSQNWPGDWDVVMIKTKRKQTALFSGIRWSKTTKSISQGRRAKIPGLRLASTHFWRKQQDEVPVFSWVPEVSYCTFVLFKDTHWWESDSAWVCGSRRNSAQMERMPWGCSYDASSILKSGLFAGGRESKEGRQTIFFTPLKPFGDISDEEEPRDDLSKPRKVHYHSKWKSRQDAVYWIILARAQDKGLQFWQTRSHAVIVCGNVPADCICKVISQKRKRTFFERLSTLRPAQKIVLKSAWQSQQQQQQQQDTSEGAASGTTKLARKEEQGNPTDNPELPSARKLERSAESPVEKEPEWKVDLRIEGIAQDVIFKDEERMGKSRKIGRVSTERHDNGWQWSPERIFWPIEGDFICRHHVELRVHLHVRERNIHNPTELHWRDQDHTDKLVRVARKPHRRLLEHWCGSTLIGLMDRIDVAHNIEW